MTVQYRNKQHHRYCCCTEATDYGGNICQYFSGLCLDRYVSEQVLQALEPSALELSLEAALHLEQDRADLERLWQHRLERAAFEAERAGRHYRLVEPENRLVARQLALDWEAKLQAHQQLQEEYQRFCYQKPKSLSDKDKQAIRQLAEDLPLLWHAETTTQAQRKEIIRQVIQSITVTVKGYSEQMQVMIIWQGGSCTQAQLVRPVARWTQLSYFPKLCQRLRHLAEAGLTTGEIARVLNQEGFRPPKRSQTLRSEAILSLMHRLGLATSRRRATQEILADEEWWLPDLARKLGMPSATLYDWIRRDWVNARQESHSPHRWIIWADDRELTRLQGHRQQPFGKILQQRWRGEVPTIALKPESPTKSLS